MTKKPIAGFPAMYANKQLLNILCKDPISVVGPQDDLRVVRAYVISYDDWLELERWYTRKNMSVDRLKYNVPVMMHHQFIEDKFEKLGWYFKRG